MPTRRALGALLAVAALGGCDSVRRPVPAGPSVAFTTVVRTDLAATLALDGTLGYGVERPVKGGGPGRVTWLPAAGAVVSRGDALFRVDDRPVTLFYGTTPLFRPLDTPGLVGRDVKTVADNLSALGYSVGRRPTVAGSPSPVKVRPGDAVLTPALVAAVTRWQRHLGLPPTGVLQVGDAVVLPQQVRISGVTAQLGDDATAPVVSVTTPAKVVTVQVEAVEADSVRAAATVTVTLPDGSTTPGHLTDLGRIAGVPDGSGAGTRPQLTATITIDDPTAIRSLDAAPVRVQFAVQARRGVLAVPVGALLALSEGGYALQTDRNTLVPVTVGLFAKGMVEVSGPAVHDGLRVVTTS